MSLRRRLAGNFWCAEKKNQGKFPCLVCRGRGTVRYKGNVRRMCKACKLTGHFNLIKILFDIGAGKMYNSA